MGNESVHQEGLDSDTDGIENSRIFLSLNSGKSMDRGESYGQIAETLLDYVETNWTDQVEDVLKVATRDYLDPERFDREMALIFKRVPLMLALSVELPAANDYKAMDVIGLPVLIARGKDGRARAF